MRFYSILPIPTLLILLLFVLVGSAQSTALPADTNRVIVAKLVIAGNKTTKEPVIRRELLFKSGDTIAIENFTYFIEKSKENLLNTALFNYVYINTFRESPTHMSVYILLEERWYLWPYVIFEHADRNFSAFLNEKDWSRINYGLMLVKNNFRGKRETVKAKFRLGYKEQFQIYYDNPYLSKNQKHGITTDITYFRQKQVQYITLNDKPQQYSNFSDYMLTHQNYNFTYYFRNKHYTVHKLSTNYTKASVADTIVSLNPNFFGNYKNQLRFFSLSYIMDHDKRDYKYYPLTGYNVTFMLSRKGLNLFNTDQVNIWDFQTSAYTYFKIYKRWYTGTGGKIKLSTREKQPYFIEGALGYDEFLRSFEYNLIDGQRYIINRAFLKYELVPTRVKVIESWNWSKFNKIHYALYTNVFFDHGYVYDVSPDPSNKLPNQYLYSFGLGIDLVTYYDQVFRFEYSVNPNGPDGFFIHLGKAF
ncbi:MAG: POTRA domain-containing protein [Salinivirgaceae bacterium]